MNLQTHDIAFGHRQGIVSFSVYEHGISKAPHHRMVGFVCAIGYGRTVFIKKDVADSQHFFPIRFCVGVRIFGCYEYVSIQTHRLLHVFANVCVVPIDSFVGDFDRVGKAVSRWDFFLREADRAVIRIVEP